MSETIAMTISAYLGGAWTDITGDVQTNEGVSASWGIKDNNPYNRLADTGMLTFSLDNSTGLYLPNGGSVISSDWKIGCKIKVDFTYMSNTYRRFYGKIDKMKIDAGSLNERKVHVTVVDWMAEAERYPLDNPAIEEDKTANQALNTIVSAMPIQPLATSYDTGNNTFPLIFSATNLKTRAYSEFNKLALSELGMIYLIKDKDNGETLVFKNSNINAANQPIDTVKVSLSSSYLLKSDGGKILQSNGDGLLLSGFTDTEISISDSMLGMDITYGEDIINRVTTSAYPTRVDTTASLIYNLDNPIYITGGASTTFNIQFTENSSKRTVSALSPDSTYPTTLMHFEVSTANNPVYEETGKSWGFSGGAGYVTNIKKFGARSLYLDGGSDTYIDGVHSDDYEFGSGDFTVEWWEYRFNAASGRAVYNRDKDGGGLFPPILLGVSDGVSSLAYFTSNGSSWDIANGVSMGAIQLNAWVHYAVCRSGNTWYTFQNGTMISSFTSSATIQAKTNAPPAIGLYNGTFLTACIDEFRMIKGLAKYTASFTPATDAYTLSGVFYNAYTQSNRGGTELTGNFLVSMDYGAAGAEITVVNAGAINGYLTSLKIYSYIVEAVSPITSIIEDADSYNEYGFHEERVEQLYQQDLNSGSQYASAVLGRYKQPRVEGNKVTLNANRSEQHAAYFLNGDVGKVVQIAETQSGLNAIYQIRGVDWSVSPSVQGVNVNYSWILKELRRTGFNYYLEYNGSVLNYVYWAYNQSIQADGVNQRLFSAWVRFNSNTGTTARKIITTTYPDNLGMHIIYSAGSYYFRFAMNSNYRSGSAANIIWKSDTAVSPNTNYHLAVYYDRSSRSNTPIMFINGVSTTVSVVSDAGDSNPPQSEVGLILSSGRDFDGRIADVRVYNMQDVSASASSLVSSIHNNGVYSNTNSEGMKFQAYGIASDEYTNYLNTTPPYVLNQVDKSIGTILGSSITARSGWT